MNKSLDIRWKQRYSNFTKAFALLEAGMAHKSLLSQLEKEGIIHRFEFTLELAWKTLKDYLEESGIVMATVTPRDVVKTAHAANIIAKSEVWLQMIDHRNLLAHTYDVERFEEALDAIEKDYLPALSLINTFFHEQCNRA
ncbi:MAG: nucleotidyltransferase substrate binding protein [Candidatus Kapaibacterium sp.]